MHELGIAQSIATAVTTRAAQHQATRITTVRVRVGEASGVLPGALAGCWDVLASLDPLLAGARLAIDVVPHRAYCRNCDAAFTITGFVAQCPTCGEWSGETLSGTELHVVDMEIETQAGAEVESAEPKAG